VDIEQYSEGELLMKLKIIGTSDELRGLALRLLDAVDEGKKKAMVGSTVVKIKRRGVR
jgi:hypothetical protein